MSEADTVAGAIDGLANPPAFMLLDLMLPDGNGIDVLRHIRASNLPITVCVVTGCGTDMLDEATRAGADHAFTKPLDVRRLMTVMTG